METKIAQVMTGKCEEKNTQLSCLLKQDIYNDFNI